MSDAIPLPARPNLEQYKKRAKDLQHRYNSGDPEAVGQVTRHSRGNAPSRSTLATAQFSLARAHGFGSWPKFGRHLQALAREQSLVSQFEAGADAIVSGDSPALERLL